MIRFRSIRDTSGPSDIPDPVSTEPPATEPRAGTAPHGYAAAFGQLGTGTRELAKGSGGLGLLLARSGFSLARSGASRLHTATRRRPVVTAAPEPSGNRGSRLRVAIGAGLLAMALGGAAAFVRSRTRPVPEPATEPPTLRPSTNGNAPTSTAPESVTS